MNLPAHFDSRRTLEVMDILSELNGGINIVMVTREPDVARRTGRTGSRRRIQVIPHPHRSRNY